MLCAHCRRCGRRSAVARGDQNTLAAPGPDEAAPRLRCDMCGARQVTVFNARGPVEMLAFLSGRI